MSNRWCNALGIARPRVESVVGHTEASTFALLLVALLERGEPMTLPEVAARLATAGVAPEAEVLASLKRCRPGRPPVYRDGDRYHLDPHDDDLDLWAFRLGLRPARVNPPRPSPVEQPPLPGPDVPLSVNELDQAWREQGLTGWSHQRLVLAVLDALGRPGTPQEIVAAVSSRTRWHGLTTGAQGFGRASSAIAVLDDGRWAMGEAAAEALRSARVAVRERVALSQRYAATRPSPEAFAEARRIADTEQAAHAAQLAQLRRAIVVAFPSETPQALAVLDVGARQLETFVGAELEAARGRIAEFDLIAAIDVRALLARLAIDAADRRLAELGPPQKTIQLGPHTRPLKITTAMLVQGSCRISRPFSDPSTMARALKDGRERKLRERLEADAKSLYALYEYGRLHGAVCLRWGSDEEPIPVPWVHRDEPRLYHLIDRALELGVALEIVIGPAPDWESPWSRAEMAFPRRAPGGWPRWLEDEHGDQLHEPAIQRARLAVAVH